MPKSEREEMPADLRRWFKPSPELRKALAEIRELRSAPSALLHELDGVRLEFGPRDSWKLWHRRSSIRQDGYAWHGDPSTVTRDLERALKRIERTLDRSPGWLVFRVGRAGLDWGPYLLELGRLVKFFREQSVEWKKHNSRARRGRPQDAPRRIASRVAEVLSSHGITPRRGERGVFGRTLAAILGELDYPDSIDIEGLTREVVRDRRRRG
jgi:hypothetical protein